MDNELQNKLAEENAVKDILKSKIDGLNAYSSNDSEIISYRLAEIVILAKDLYTDLFKEIIDKDSRDEKIMWNQIMGIRMHLLHLKDCIDTFDSSLIEFMQDKEELEKYLD